MVSRCQLRNCLRSHGWATMPSENQWEKLNRFLEYPELELSNNLAENSMRPVAIGRRNWIHVGSPQAGPKIAAILSVVESCRRLKISVRDYLASVLPGLADLSIQRLPELIPAAWVPQYPQAQIGNLEIKRKP